MVYSDYKCFADLSQSGNIKLSEIVECVFTDSRLTVAILTIIFDNMISQNIIK